MAVQPGGLWLDFSLQLVAADPRKYTAAEHTTDTGLPGDSVTGLDFDAGGGTGLDFATPNTTGDAGLDFGPQVDTARVTATNAGTADTAPTFTLTGPLAPPVTIVRPDNGARITYRDRLDETDQLVIDTTRRLVVLGTASRRHRTSVSDWDAFAIPPESTVDYVLGHSGSPNTTARLRVTWRSAWW